MEIVRGLRNLSEAHHGCVLTIGNFDGVHRGHQALLGRVIENARQHGVPACLLTFEPTPLECFDPANAPPRVQGIRERLTTLEQYGADRVVVVRFDRQFAAIEAEDFVRNLLGGRLGVRHLVIGDDFRFGKGRSGDFALLQQMSAELGFSVESAPTVQHNGERISSSRVRSALAAGQIEQAQSLLGHDYVIQARATQGLGLGRKLGAATFNFEVHPPRALRHGVYAVTLRSGGHDYPAVANFGLRPTVEASRDATRPLLEVHVLGTPPDELLHACIVFHRHIRDEKRFDGLDALREQIQRDVAAARAWFGESPPQAANPQ